MGGERRDPRAAKSSSTYAMACARAQRLTTFRPARPARRCSCSSTAAIGSATGKKRYSFLASGPLARGINVAVPGYMLAPEARLTDIVAEVRQALTFLADRAGALGFDRNNIHIGGWSAGGHLVVAVADHPAVRGECRSAAFSISNRSRLAS